MGFNQFNLAGGGRRVCSATPNEKEENVIGLNVGAKFDEFKFADFMNNFGRKRRRWRDVIAKICAFPFFKN